MQNLAQAFEAMSGKFVGRGINHEGQPFTGTFETRWVTDNRGIAFTFQAIGDDGAIYHSESSLIGRTMQGKLGLWVLSSNHPGIFERILVTDSLFEISGFVWVFGFGIKDDSTGFREEIQLKAQPKNSIEYTYSWGMPGGEFAERSRVLMKLV